MRKLAAYFFISIYLFANTELRELVKIGAFIDHYAEHQKKDEGLSLLDFIIIHYFSGNIIDDDYAQDMQLPFKSVDCSTFSPIYSTPTPDFTDLPPLVLAESDGLPRYDQSLLPSSHLSDIWQPPKAC